VHGSSAANHAVTVWTYDPDDMVDTGVYLYHMPMGRSGVAKADNFHGWGHRFSSFWCASVMRIQIHSYCQLWHMITKGMPLHSAASVCRVTQVLLWHGRRESGQAG
jgi:hypothetical protein